MLNKLKIFYGENRTWMSLAKHIFLSIILAVAVILIDTKFISILSHIPDLFLTSVTLANLILSTLTGALLTITTFTFSTIMVVLTMYSSDFSPRVVNNFLNDKITMKVLGMFVGGFFYCILTLFFMRKSYSDYLVVSATIAVIYSALCIIYFVIFVYRVSSSIQATKLIARLYDESFEIIERDLKLRENSTSFDKYEVGVFKFELDVISDKNGYLELINLNEILNSLKDISAKLLIKADIGSFICINQKIATLYYDEKLEDEKLMDKLQKQFSIEKERIAFNDYRFSLQKIIDITLRSISPGINDPNTAIHCINILGVLLSKLGEIRGRFSVIKDENSKSVIIHEDFHFKEDLYYSFYQIVHYGKKDISIILAILNALKTISLSASSEKSIIIREFGDYVYDSSINHFSHKLDKDIIKSVINSI